MSSVEAGSLFNVNGMVALVTGGGTGIGLMLTKALAHNGAAKVYIAGRRLDVLKTAASSIGPNVIPIQCDVTSKDDIKKAVDFIEKDIGYLNLLVCNSGISGPHPGNFDADTSLEDWADRNLALGFDDYVQTFSVNVAAVWFSIMSFLKLLDKGNQKKNLEQTSQVVVTSSIASLNKRAPGGWAYGQSKAGVTHLVKQLSSVLPQWKIRINAIAPGYFPSEMANGVLEKYKGPDGEYSNVPKDHIPFQRIGDEKDMGGTMLYLASRAGAYNNGNVTVVDGGRLSTFPSVF